jgi:uncharacterized Zn-finger protein
MTASSECPPTHDFFCNGGDNGHPGIYLTANEEGKAACPYCGKKFSKTQNSHESSDDET